ncbi:MAG: MFS transporter, partial [Hyphomicrobium denitrificans]|nr:MFS transporter [Hyphomicrobium denitrificans]
SGGQFVYVTCSILPEENVEQVAAFLDAHRDFRIVPTAYAWTAAGLAGEVPVSADGRSDTLLLSPGRHGTDGFFIAVLARSA